MNTIWIENLKTLKGKEKIRYIWDYFKLPLVILAILIYILAYALHQHFSYKESILYTALVNVNAGEELTKGLSLTFLDYMELDHSKNKIELYSDLYLTDDAQNAYHQYAYASRIKILAVIEGKLLDVVIMNKEAFDAFSQNGYLLDLAEFLPQADAGLYETVKPNLVTNITILEHKTVEHQQDSPLSYETITEEHYYGIDLSDTELIRSAGFTEPVYLGIIANSPRTDNVLEYLKYLYI